MKTNQVMTRPMGQFKVSQRTRDAYFNATALLKQWNEALGTKYAIEDFIARYIPNTVREQIVDREKQDFYLPIALEPQLRLHVANYDLALYDMLDASVVTWNISIPISESTNEIIKSSSQQTYLMIDETSGAVKIGRTHNPQFREKTLGAQIPHIRLIATCIRDVERELHNKFKAKRMRGEWFNLSQNDIRDIIKQYGFETK